MLIIEPSVRKIKQNEKRILRVFMIIERQIVPAYTVFQLGFQKGRVLVLKKGSLVRCWIFKKGIFRDTVKSNKVYNEILTFIIYT